MTVKLSFLCIIKLTDYKCLTNMFYNKVYILKFQFSFFVIHEMTKTVIVAKIHHQGVLALPTVFTISTMLRNKNSVLKEPWYTGDIQCHFKNLK